MNTIRPNSLVIIKLNNMVLVEKGIDKKTGEIFYRLLGGGIEFGETSNQAIKREIIEELNLEITNEELLRVIENIFEYNGEPYHEITFLYQAEILNNADINTSSLISRADKEGKFAEWVSIDRIKNNEVKLYPEIASIFF